MDKKILILDCNFLCHRLKYTMGGLSHGGSPTGVIYGFLKTITALQRQFNTPHIVFCWDSKTSIRQQMYRKYKAHRKDKYKGMSKKEIKFEKEFRRQMKLLRRVYLPTIGYKNVFVQPGYEADDIISTVTINLSMKDEAVIVSSDKDLYQLIRPHVSFYNPAKGKILTYRRFTKKYGIKPYSWGTLKALAGCVTDNVKGVKGIGEKTAIKFLKGTLKETTKAFKAITSLRGLDIYERNKKLVILPLTGSKNFMLKEDEISEKGWKEVMEALGMKSLKNKPPIFKRKKKRRKK